MENTVVVHSARGLQEISLHGELLASGIIFITGEISSETSRSVISKLLFLKKRGIDPVVYIDSNGGSVSAGLAICDSLLSFPGIVTTVCTANCFSMAAPILSCGTKNYRFILPHAKTMVHQPLIHQIGGNADSMQQISIRLSETHNTICTLLSETTGKDVSEIRRVMEHGDYYMTAEESVRFGLCDGVIDNIFDL